MELNITELNNVNTMNPYDTFDYNAFEEQNAMNYWEKTTSNSENRGNTQNKEKRKKVSFDDILSNMNLLVNKQGVLQFMTINQNEAVTPQTNHNQNNYSMPSQNQRQSFVQHNVVKEEPINNSVKHSYIYNKYFKDYNNSVAEQPIVRVPKTIQEYRQMLLEDRIKAIEHKKRIEQIKSTKMLFTTTEGSNLNPRNVVASKNNLRSMNFM
jgi:hypothetical protein